MTSGWRSPHRTRLRLALAPTPPLLYAPSIEPQPANPYTATAGSTCTRCGYTLTGLPSAGLCPECGLPLAESLRPDLLRFAKPAYTRKLYIGALVLSTALLLATGGWLLVAAIILFDRSLIDSIASPIWSLNILLIAGLYGGWWLLATRDPDDEERGNFITVRHFLRGAVVVLAAAYVADLSAAAYPHFHGSFASIFRLLKTPALIIGFIASIIIILRLAYRIPDDSLIRTAVRSLWLIPLLFILVWVIGGLAPLELLANFVAIALYLYLNLRLTRRLHRIRADQARITAAR